MQIPRISSLDTMSIAANDSIEGLKNPQPALPSLQLNTSHYDTLKKVVDLFNATSKKTSSGISETRP